MTSLGWLPALPEVTEADHHGNRSWTVDGKTFAWERSLEGGPQAVRRGDATSPAGARGSHRRPDREGSRVAGGHEGRLHRIPTSTAMRPSIELRAVGKRPLKELLTDGWLACAPPALAERHMRKR